MSNIPFVMSIIMYFIRLDVFRLEQNWFDFLNKVFATCGVRHRKPGSGAVKPHIKNNYRIEVKHVFLAIVYRGLCCEFF